MTDKEKILQEIERLQKPTTDINNNFTSDYNQGFYDGLSQLELFLDKMKEESVSDDLEAEFVLYLKHKFNIPQEGNTLKTDGWSPSSYDILDIAKHFAQWQKEQMMRAAIKGTARPLDDEVWSEEDEDILNDIINHFDRIPLKHQTHEIFGWLVSLKHRIGG